MNSLKRIGLIASSFITGIGRVAAWAGFLLMIVINYDVVSRKLFSTGSTLLQELEWHLHAVLFLFCLGYGYIANAHVRIDVIRERLSERSKRWIEVFGCLLFLIPYFGLCTIYGADLVMLSFTQDEGSPNVGGLPNWWIIKSLMILAFLLVGIAGIAVLIKSLCELFEQDSDGQLQADRDMTPDRNSEA